MPYPQMHQVDSSNVQAVGYDADNREIYVEFIGGDTYVYSEADQATFDGLLHASSVGSYLNRVIKGNLGYRRL